MIDVACVGILVADVIAKTVDKLPGKGLLGLVDSIELFSGGNAMTAAINIKKLGCNSAIIGRIGTDPFGDYLEVCLEKNGVDTKGLVRDTDVQTSTSVALSGSDGERTFLHCVGANAKFSLEDIDWNIIRKCKIVFVTGIYLMNTFDGTETVEFLKRCKKLGKITAADVCWDDSGRWESLINDAMPYIDIFMPSIDEAKMIAKKEKYEDIANSFFDRGVKCVVIKLGNGGCYVQENKKSNGVIVPAYKNIDVVDTTGAGDSFCAGFLTALMRGNDFLECAQFANAVGACNVMARGATTGIKSYGKIIEFMKEKSN